MKKALWKRVIAVCIAAAMMLETASCGGQNGKQQAETDDRQLAYEGTDLTFAGIEGDISSIAVRDEKLYLQTYQQIQEGTSGETGYGKNRLYVSSLDGGNPEEIPVELPGDMYPGSILPGADGTITLLLYAYDQKDEASVYWLVKLDRDGRELERENITKLLQMEQETYISKALLDEKGNVLVEIDKSVYVLDEDFQFVYEIRSENVLEGMALTKDGQVICAGSSLSKTGEWSAAVRVLDVDKRKWGDTIRLGLFSFSGTDAIMDGCDYDFYYKGESGVYGYSIEEEKETKLLDYLSSNMSTDRTCEILPIEGDRFIGMIRESRGASSKTGVAVYTRADASAVAQKATIVCGALVVDEELKDAVAAFNEKNNAYQIELRDYGEEEDPVMRMNADMASGNAPDMIDLVDLPVQQYAAKGMLEDLTPYFDQDPELGLEDILDPVLDGMQIDGKLYYVTPYFQIITMAGRTEDVGEETGWTFDELKALLEKKGDGVRPFYDENKWGILYSFLGHSITDFVDWETGECSFDSGQFQDILEICNKGTNEETDRSVNMYRLFRDRKILFFESTVSLADVFEHEKLYGEDINYIGYPNKDKMGSYFDFSFRIGMLANSGHKEGVWEFIRTFMTKEYQGGIMQRFEAPTRKDCLDMVIKKNTTTEPYTDEFGWNIEPLNGIESYEDGTEIEITPLSQAQVDKYLTLLNHTGKSSGYDEKILDIVFDEVEPYFAGEKSLEETTGIIQRRVQTYVNENR